MTWRQSSSVTSSAGAWTQAPALLTRTSTRPNRSSVAASTAATSSGDGHVGGDEGGLAPPPVMPPRRSGHAPSSRPTSMTEAPASASAAANPSPSPRVPPVTTATRPSRLETVHRVHATHLGAGPRPRSRVTPWAGRTSGSAAGSAVGSGRASPWPRGSVSPRCWSGRWSPSGKGPTFGWFAYAPLSDHGLDQLVTQGELVGWGLGVLGLLVLAWVVGYLTGARRGPGPAPGASGQRPTRAATVQADALRVNEPAGARRRHSRRTASRLSSSIPARYWPAGPTPSR